MKKLFGILGIIVSLAALSGCDNNSTGEPVPAVSPEGVVSTPHVTVPETTNPAIDEQIADLRENNGDIPQEERDRLNNVPVIPDVFDK